VRRRDITKKKLIIRNIRYRRRIANVTIGHDLILRENGRQVRRIRLRARVMKDRTNLGKDRLEMNRR